MPIPRLEPAPGYVVIPVRREDGKRRYILAQETGRAPNGARLWKELGDYGEYGDAARQSHTLYVLHAVAKAEKEEKE